METIDHGRRTKSRTGRGAPARTAVASLAVATTVLGTLAVGSTSAAADSSGKSSGELTNVASGQKMAAYLDRPDVGEAGITIDPRRWTNFRNINWTLEPQEDGKHYHLK